MKIVVPVVALSLLAGCQPAPPEQTPVQSTAVVLTDVRPGTPLDEMLQLLDAELVQAMAGRLEGESLQHFRRAEAITDRLLEARLPFEWIDTEQYTLDARLRQIQSLADRVMAQVQTNAPRDSALLELRQLRTDVLRLRETIARGGGPAPPPLHQLLTDTGGVRAPRPAGTTAPAAPSGPRPLGTPVTTGG